MDRWMFKRRKLAALATMARPMFPRVARAVRPRTEPTMSPWTKVVLVAPVEGIRVAAARADDPRQRGAPVEGEVAADKSAADKVDKPAARRAALEEP